MDTQQEAIQTLIRINRDALRELARVAETTSADYLHIDNAMRMLGEQFHILLQQKEELETTATALEQMEDCGAQREAPCVTSSVPYATETSKRGRGAEKKFYLCDEAYKPNYIAQIERIFTNHYTPSNTFLLPDGTEAKAPEFLACLYDIGVKDGITSPEAPVYDLSCILKEAAHECPNAQNFNTAYNTIQKAVRKWKPFTGNEAHYYGINVRFHNLKPEQVPHDNKDAYNRWLSLYTQVEQIYNVTKA